MNKIYRLERVRLIPLLVSLCFFLTIYSRASEILLKGAELGKWTMDKDAAVKLAQENQVAIFMDFTGSDWCGWCKIMKKKIFSHAKWDKFAKANLSLLTIDFPRGQNIVPDYYLKRNQDLQAQYSVMGYPTYIVVDSDGKMELGRLGASNDQNVDRFIGGVRQFLERSTPSISKFIQGLPAEKAKEYQKLLEDRKSTQTQLERWLQSKPSQSEQNLVAFLSFNSKLTKLTVKIEGIEAENNFKQLSAQKAKEYLSTVSELNQARLELDDWLVTRPEGNNDDQQKRAIFEMRIRDLSEKTKRYK